MKAVYVPRPMDTSDIQIPEELIPLIEKISENVHEVWSQTRMEQGWTFGIRRDDHQKRHPGLVPYQHLSEDEKQYDRNTSVETLKMIIKLGFKITKG